LHGIRADPAFCADCIVDLTLTRFVFKAYLEACRVLGREGDEAALMGEVREILDHFPEYATAQSHRGKVFVSVSGESPEQVYNTPNPLTPVFPGEDIGLHSPKEVLEIAMNTWRHQQNEGGNELVFQNLQGARLGVLDLERFKRQVNYCLMPNGTCADMVLQSGGRYGDDTDYAFMAPMGIWFENFSLPVVVNECLLQSYTGRLRFFANWPKNRDAMFQDLRAVGAFLVSAECAGGRVQWIRVKAEADGPLRVINPWPAQVEVARNGSTMVVSGSLLEIETRGGDTITLREKR
jgi:alpha-L-fucosidase 2